MNLYRFLIPLLVLPALFSCQEPVRNFCWIELDPSAGLDSAVTLVLDINATMEPQQLDLSMRVCEYGRDYSTIPLLIRVKSPSGLIGNDTIALPLDAKGYMTLNWIYRKNILNKEAGEWEFTIAPLDNGEYRDFYRKITGLGIVCKKEEKQDEF